MSGLTVAAPIPKTLAASHSGPAAPASGMQLNPASPAKVPANPLPRQPPKTPLTRSALPARQVIATEQEPAPATWPDPPARTSPSNPGSCQPARAPAPAEGRSVSIPEPAEPPG